MKRFIFALVALAFMATPAWAGLEDRFSDIQLKPAPDNYVLGPELSSNPSGDPASGWWRLFGRANNLYFEADDGTVSALIPSGSTAWDDIGDPDANGSIDFTDYYADMDFGDTDHDMLTLWFTGAFGDVSGMVLEQKTGNPTDGTLFELKLADSDPDFVSFKTGGVEKVNITAAGGMALSDDLSVGGNLSVTGTTTLTGTMYQPSVVSASSGNVNLTIDAAGTGTITLGGTSTGKVTTDNVVEMFGNVDIGNANTDTLSITSIIDSNVTLDDGTTDSPSLILKDATDETGTFVKTDGSHTTFTPNAAGQALQVLTGNLRVGNGSPGTASMDGEDFYCEGESEFDGAMQVDGAATFASTVALAGTTTATFGAAEYLKLDSNTTASTTTGGALDIDFQTATNTGKAVSLTVQLEDGATLAYGIEVDVDDDTSGAEVIHAFSAENAAGTNATTKGFYAANTLDVGFESVLGAAFKALYVDATTTAHTGTAGAIDIDYRTATDTSHAINLDVESDLAGAGEIAHGLKIQMDDDAGNADNEIHGIHIDTDANGTGLQHAIYVGGTAGIDAALYAANGYVRVGTGATPDVTPGDDDVFVEGTLEVDGASRFDGDTVINATANLGSDSELTISGGVITATKSFHNVDTEGDGASDDLDTINGGTEGDILTIVANNAGRSVVVKNGTGNIVCGGDHTLDNTGDTFIAIYDGTNWLELSFADNN